MNRRSFFRFLGAGAATLALSEAIPFGRVWSFPSKIVVPDRNVITLTLTETYGVDFAWDDYERCVITELNGTDIRRTYYEPAARQLANQIDARIVNMHVSPQKRTLRRIARLLSTPLPA